MEISINDLNTYQLPSNCFSSHYKILSFLGEGSYGKVFKAREISTGRVIAVKKMSIGDSQSKYNKIIKEINLLKSLDHPNIVKYYDFFQEEEYIYLMMEYLEGCTLKQYIKNNENISEDNARIIIKQLLTALSYLHYTCDICHRDVKPENIMFKEKNDINHLKLLDFGLSLDSFESKKHLENCGTLVYMAPELLNNIKYTKGVDVWSVGIILYMLLMKGKNPFYNKGDSRETIIKNIRSNNVIFSCDNDNLNQISKMGKDLINKLLKKNPLYRYTIRSALEHPWITMNKFDKIPLTIYDKANIDENVERLKLFLLVAIFLNYSKKDNLFMNDNPNDKKISNNFEDVSDDTNLDYENGNFSKNKKVKSMKQIRNRKKFDMKEYEKMVKNSNKIYHLKFIEDREIMFNPKLSSKNNVKNINDLSSIIKRIKQNQSKEDCSTMFLENSTIRKKSKNFDYLQKSSSNKKLLFNDEQKNSETLEQPNYSKMKTPFKLKNSFLDTSRTIIQKTKLKRRFSAMPKVLNKGNNEEYIWNKMTKREKGTSIIRNLKNNNLDIIQNKKKELDFKLFSKRIEKSKKLRTNSAKNVNMYYHAVDRSVNINNKNRKWHLPFKKENLVKNNFPLLNKGYNINNKTLKKKLEKQIMDVKILLSNKEKEKIILKKKTSILSVTEHTQNSISEFKNSKKNFPIIL
jgi:serine/threonine protein kinase